MVKVVFAVQARSNSTRLPGKIFELICQKQMLKMVTDAAESVKLPSKIFTSQVMVIYPEGDEKVETWCKENKADFMAGPEEDVLSRYVMAQRETNADIIVRLTADCPFLMPDVIAACVGILGDVDYCSNTVIRSYPEGLDVQGCSKDALKWFDGSQATSREHPFALFDNNSAVREEFVNKGFTWKPLINLKNPIFTKLSVDTPQDLAMAREYERSRTV